MDFPDVIDSSLIACFRSCPRKAELEFLQHYKSLTPSVHLHAGAAFASGLEAARTAFYLEGKPPSESIAAGLKALLESYGDFECPSDSAKSLERMLGALEYYFTAWPLGEDKAIPIKFPGGKQGIEFSFLEPLDINHPVTGDPLLYSGRMDMAVSFNGMQLGEDDKTTSQLGASWPRQWNLRCFSEDTEVLTADGWVTLPELKEGVEIAQWNKGTIEFIIPTDLHSTPFKGELLHIQGQKIDQLVTPNHRLLLNLRRGGSKTVLAENLQMQDEKHSIPLAGVMTSEIVLPEAFQRYIVAVQADGSLQFSRGKVKTGRGHREHMPFPATRFSFTKKRKYLRLIEILSDIGATWTEQVTEDGHYTIHVSGFEQCQEHLMLCLNENKEFKHHILPLLDETFIEELQYWDGWSSQYYTTNEHNARFVQSVAHCTGYRCSVKKKINHTVSYVVVLSKDTEAMLKSVSVKSVAYNSNVWCLSVPSTFLLTRRNGIISVSGNSQFTSYCWGAQRAGIKLDGFLVRGVSILKTKYDHAETITYRPAWQIERWYKQLLKDVIRMIEMWKAGDFDYNLDHACSEYGGCQFSNVCQMLDPQALLNMQFQRRKWDPVTRTETVLEV